MLVYDIPQVQRLAVHKHQAPLLNDRQPRPGFRCVISIVPLHRDLVFVWRTALYATTLYLHVLSSGRLEHLAEHNQLVGIRLMWR